MPYEITSSVITAASTYDLTTLAVMHDELNIPSNDTSKDASLARIITAVSAGVAKYCNRVFALETVRDVIFPQRDAYPYQVPGDIAPLQLSRWPIVQMVRKFGESQRGVEVAVQRHPEIAHATTGCR